VRLPDLAATGDTPVDGIVELRPAPGGPQVVHRSDLSLAAQVTADGATWLDRRLLVGAERNLPDHGFGAEVRGALEARRAWLVTAGLARRDSRGVTVAPDLLATLRGRELAVAAARIARETGLEPAPLAPGEAVAGTCLRRVDLASGRFVAVQQGGSVRLAPWARALDRRLGRAVSGRMTPEGMAWDLGRGPELRR
jgi:hypothetical protein